MDKEFVIKYLKRRNYWWESKKINDEDKGIERKEYINEIENALKLDRIICLSGIRRCGKSTLMFQMIDRLIKSNIEPKNIVYTKIDDLLGKISSIHDIVDTYFEITGISQNKIFLFFDEIHFMEDWHLQLKFYIDANFNGKFIVSGSSKTLLYKNASESLVGRIRFINVFPLTFREFVKFNNINVEIFPAISAGIDEIKKIYYNLIPKKEKLLYLFGEYIKVGGFPEWFKIKNILEWRKILVDDYLSLILFKDIVHAFKINDPLLLEKLVKEAAKISTQRFTYVSLSNRLDANRETIKLYLYYLSSSSLLFISDIYSKNKKTRERAEKKIYFWEEGMRRALTLDEDDATSVENIIAWHLIKEGFSKKVFFEPFYWKNRHEVDFVLDTNILLPVEVKYRENPYEIKGMLDFMSKFSVEKGIVITKDVLNEKIFDVNGKKVKILFIPAWLFLLGINENIK